MRGGWSLRRRLVVATAVVAIVGIVVVDVATWTSLRDSLEARLEKDLARVLEQQPPPPPGQGEAPPPGSGGRRPPPAGRATPVGTWMGVLVGRELEFDRVSRAGYMASPGPTERPDPAVVERGIDVLLDGAQRVDAEAGPGSFLVQARELEDGNVYVAGVPTGDMDATLDRLLRIELAVSAVVGLAVLLLAWLVVRAGLRPLEQIAQEASEIAYDGDGHGVVRRVHEGVPGTEVGRLSGAINGMLERIDASLDARRRTEEQLRRFVADASHELRTPLTSIQGFAELARSRAAQMSPEELDGALATVERETRHLADLVADLLLLARLDEGMRLRPGDVDVAAVAGHAVEAARVVEPGREISLEVARGAGDADEDGLHLRADPARVRQLLDNLLANVRAHAGDDASVHVGLRRIDGETIGVVVTDTGRGMSAAARARALERFWRADDARGRDSGGSGLGLGIVGAIAEAHGGTVELGPAEGGGLRVDVVLRALPAMSTC